MPDLTHAAQVAEQIIQGYSVHQRNSPTCFHCDLVKRIAAALLAEHQVSVEACVKAVREATVAIDEQDREWICDAILDTFGASP